MSQKYKVTTSTDPLRIRSEAKVDSDGKNIVARVPKGEIVEEAGSGVIVPVAGWTYVCYDGKYGYASSQYLTPVDDGGNKTAEPDKSVQVVDDSTTTDTGDKKEPNGKAWMIAGGAVLAIGAILNLVL